MVGGLMLPPKGMRRKIVRGVMSIGAAFVAV